MRKAPSSIYSKEVQSVINNAHFSASPSPSDWRDQCLYYIMVDRFNNPNRPPLHMPFDDQSYRGFQGGSYSGVIQALPYLASLGVGTIWLGPVLKNLQFDKFTYHGYGIHDFLSAEPRFADDPDFADEELRSLVDAAHETGIYVIFDIVLNHTGDVFAYRCAPEDRLCRESNGSVASFHDESQQALWRDETGTPRYTSVEEIPNPPLSSYNTIAITDARVSQ